MLTKETKQQVDLHISDYKDELGNDEFIIENVRMTPVRRAVKSVERFVRKMKDRLMPGRHPYWQG